MGRGTRREHYNNSGENTVAWTEWQQVTAKEMGDSRYILEVNSGLSDGLEVWREVRESLE